MPTKVYSRIILSDMIKGIASVADVQRSLFTLHWTMTVSVPVHFFPCYMSVSMIG